MDYFRKTTALISILAGLAIAAFGVVAFVLPSGIIIGSATGIGRILYYFFGIPVSYTVAAVNGLLFLFGAMMLGKKFAGSILVSTFTYPLFMNLFERAESLQNITKEPLLAAIFGGLFIGFGLGIVIRMGASSGGTDIIAVVLNRKAGVPIGLPMYLIDILILLTQILFAESMDQILLGALLTLLYSIIANKVVIASDNTVQIMIISSKYREIRSRLVKLVVGHTVLYGETGYTENRQPTILVVTSNRELSRVRYEILSIDAEAFMIISSVKEIKGRGFSFDVGRAKKIREMHKEEL